MQLPINTNQSIYYPKFRYSFLLVLFITTFFNFAAKSQGQEAIDQQDWISRNQQNILEENKRTKEFETIKKDREQKEKQKKELEELNGLKISGKLPECFLIKEINLIDANSISSFHKKRIINPFIGKCIEEKILSKIVAAVNEYYQSNGYITTQVVVPNQNLKSGIFVLKVIEGKIEKIVLGKDRIIENMQKFTAFGKIEGSILNIDDINQGIYQINRLQSNAAVMKIKPGSKIGESGIVIDNNKKFPAKFTIGKDNLGNEFTGIQRINFSSNLDNLLFLNDNTSLNYTTNTHDNSQKKDIKTFSGSISVPFKYNSFSYDYYHSEFKGQNVGENSTSTLTGFSSQKKFALDRVLLNNTNNRLSANSSLALKESASYLDDQKIETTERKLSIMSIGLAISSYLNNSTNLYLKPSYSKGLKILNAKKDQSNLSEETPKAQFKVFKLYSNISKKIIFPRIDLPITITSEMDSQFSKDTLFGSEQFSVGGYYSVRGFRERYINGDSGYYFRNKANVNLGSLIIPFFTKNDSGSILQKNLVHLNKFKLEPFYDYGYVRNKYDGSDGRLAGAGFKSIFESKYFNAYLTYSWATNHSKLITSTTKENKLIYFEITANCC